MLSEKDTDKISSQGADDSHLAFSIKFWKDCREGKASIMPAKRPPAPHEPGLFAGLFLSLKQGLYCIYGLFCLVFLMTVSFFLFILAVWGFYVIFH